MRPCFVFRNLDSAEAATLSIHDEIGFWGVQAKDFISDLGKVKAKTIKVEINSPGGDVFAGLAIYNALKGAGKEIVVKVMGVAASAASLIAMAGDKIVMPKNTFMMVHNPWSIAMGNADKMRETAETLDKIGSSLRSTYAARTGLDEAELDEMLAKDTWLTADEAKEKGFATEVVEDVKAQASFDMARADLPENVKAVFAMAQAKTGEGEGEGGEGAGGDDDANDSSLTDQIDAAAKAAGLEAHAALFAVSYDSMDKVNARIGECREIKALCAFVKKDDMADEAIKAGKTLADVRAQLASAMAKTDDATRTSGTKPAGAEGNEPGTGSNGTPKVTTNALWAAHKKGRK